MEVAQVAHSDVAQHSLKRVILDESTPAAKKPNFEGTPLAKVNIFIIIISWATQ